MQFKICIQTHQSQNHLPEPLNENFSDFAIWNIVKWIFSVLKIYYHFEHFLFVLQVSVYKDDFEKEHAEHERTKTERDYLRSQIYRNETEIQKLSGQLHAKDTDYQHLKREYQSLKLSYRQVSFGERKNTKFLLDSIFTSNFASLECLNR